MELLRQRILQDGKCYEGGILKVDSFINHQMDPVLMKSIGVEFVRRFASTSVNKIMTIEASGIAPAIMTGYLMDLPVVFAKKKTPKTIENVSDIEALRQSFSLEFCILAAEGIRSCDTAFVSVAGKKIIGSAIPLTIPRICMDSCRVWPYS